MQTPEIHSNIPNLHEKEKCMYHTNITQIKGEKKDNIKEISLNFTGEMDHHSSNFSNCSND